MPARLSGACAGVRPKGEHTRALVSQEATRRGGADSGGRLPRPSRSCRPQKKQNRLRRSRAAAAGTRGGRGREKKTAQPPRRPRRRKPRRRPKRPGRKRRGRREPLRLPTPKAALPKVKKEIFVSVEVGEQRVAVLEDGQRRRGLPRAARTPLGRRQHLQGHRRQRAARAWRPRSWTSASRRTAFSTSTRSSCPSSKASGTGAGSRT